LPVPEQPGPILPVYPKEPGGTPKLRRALLAAGIYPPFVRYVKGPANGYFRFVISSEHTPAQLKNLVQVLIQQTRPEDVA
jgi:7-keto-8-aminopelargonate synthetase-like enzyme